MSPVTPHAARAGADDGDEGAPDRAGPPGVLYPAGAARPAPGPAAIPSFFYDLNLDQILAKITEPYREYDLTSFFLSPPGGRDTVGYRQEIMRDMEGAALAGHIAAFTGSMQLVRRNLRCSKDASSVHERDRWILDAALHYCDAVEQLSTALQAVEPASRGIRSVSEYLADYAMSPGFLRLRAEARTVRDGLSGIRYSLLIGDGRVTVMPLGDEGDYAAAVARTFEKFAPGATRDYRVLFPGTRRLDHVGARILERVARLNPEVFRALAAFAEEHANFVDDTIGRFEREIHFYVAYLAFIRPIEQAGLQFCHPRVDDDPGDIECRGGFDLALASTLAGSGAAMVRNDFSLRDAERILVVTGPNHGGKTTFARMFGQLHYLAALGCPVPATSARLLHFDRIFTHFGRGENVADLRGKLQDDLVRIREILAGATGRSVVILNELFASTTLEDARYLSRKVLAAISRLGAVAVCVTFLDELASFDAGTVSLVSAVDARDPSVRTFRLERRPADGLAYSMAIAEKYRVTREALRQRLSA